MNVAYGLPANDGQEYDRKIDSVSKEDLARFMSTISRNRIESNSSWGCMVERFNEGEFHWSNRSQASFHTN